MLHTLLSNKVEEPKKRQVLEEEYDIQMSEKMEKEVSAMCNLSQGILEQGIQQGFQQGEEKGLKRGMHRGRQEQRIKDERQNIKRMKKLLAAGIDKATIANVFDCSVAELEALSPKQTR